MLYVSFKLIKHVVIMEVLRGSLKAEVTPAQAMSLILDRFL